MARTSTIEFLLTQTPTGWDDDTCIDGVVVEGYCIDFNEIARSLASPGVYEIFTCGCGVAGCAGIFEGVRVRHEASHIAWSMTQPYQAEYTFCRSEMVKSLREFLLKAVELKATIGPTLYQMIGAPHTLGLLDGLAP